jgi:hypothetical protein
MRSHALLSPCRRYRFALWRRWESGPQVLFVMLNPYHELAVEYVEPGGFRQLDSIPVPLEALADIEGRDDSSVVLEAVEPDRTIVRWQDRGIPRTREYAVTLFGKIAAFPDAPAAWTRSRPRR